MGRHDERGRLELPIRPWCILVPGAALFIAVTVFNVLGDVLRDYLDARGRRVPENVGNKKVAFLGGKADKGKEQIFMSKAMMGRRGFVVAAACTLALALTGCAGGGAQAIAERPQSDESSQRGLDFVFHAESMDPANSWDGWEMQYYGITENLLKLDEDFNVEPWLAKSVERIDDLTWKFELRDDVTFTNGEKMTGDG